MNHPLDIRAVTEDARYSLTRAQQMFWAARILRPGRPVDNRVMKIEWRLPLDTDAFRLALHALVERTDSLRLLFGEEHGVPYQYAARQVDPALEVRDFSDDPDPFAAANAWLDERSARVLDISERVFETALARLGPDQWIWHLNQHHIATDFNSAALLLERLSDLYGQALKGDIPPGAAPYPSYLGFLSRHPEFCAPPSLPEDEAGGGRRPAPLPRMYALPARDRGPAGTRMLRFETNLGPERLSRMRTILGVREGRDEARYHGLFFNFFATGVLAFVSRVSGQRKVTVGTPTHNRYLAGSDTVAGLFIRMLPIHVEMDEDWTFRDLMNALQTERRRVFAAAKSGSAITDRRYNVVINHITRAMPDFHGATSRDLTTTRVADAVGLDLSLTIRTADTPGDMKLLFDVNEELLQIVDTEKLADQFMRVLDAMLEDVDSRPGTVFLADPATRSAAESAAQAALDAPAPPFQSLPQAFLARARETPDKEAVLEGQTTLSYAALEARSRAVAAGLRRRGVARGDIVAVQIPRSLDLVVAMFGIMRAGAVYCPMDIWGPEERAAWIIADIHPPVVLTRRDTVLGPAFDNVEPVVIEDLLAEPGPAGPPESLPECVPRDRAYITYTSGTSGVPKGVEVCHESLVRYLQWRHATIYRGTPVCFAFTAPVTFDASLRCLVGLYGGGSVRVYPETGRVGEFVLADVLTEDAVHAAMATPSQLRLLVDRRWTLSRLKSVSIVGEPLPTELALQAREAFGPAVEILNNYGPTEATLVSTFHRFHPDADTNPTVPLGRPASDVAVHILDAGLNPVPPGVPGEIHIGGARLAEGYLNNPGLTQERFIPDPFCRGSRLYRTGDLGWCDRDGNLFYLGRADSQFKINGIRAEVAEVEAAVCGHSRVTGCAVGFTGDHPARLVAWYVAEEEIPPGQLRAAAARYVAGALVPTRFMRIDALPLTRNGKIDRRALPPFDGNAADHEPTPPRTLTEELLVTIWRRILDTDRIGIEDDFLDLGGDSLSAIRVMHETEECFQVRLPVESIDRITTIASFAATVDRVLAQSGESPEPPGEPPSAPDEPLGGSSGENPAQAIDPEVLRRLRIYMTGWTGERVDDGALMFRYNADGSRPPLFWCFNNQTEFAEMARHLGPDQPLYGVRSLKGVLKNKAEKKRYDRLIGERHVEELLRVNPEGPFYIGGNCQATRIAMWMARHLIDRNKPVALLCLMEQVPLLPYPGRVALFFGRDSERHNQFKKFTVPEIGWKRFFREVVWDVVPGRHGEFFRSPNIEPLCERIAARLEEARARVMTPLPEDAYAAGIELVAPPESLGPGENRCLQIRVQNRGTAIWRPGEESGIYVVYRWLRNDGSEIPGGNGAAPLPQALAPGDSCEFDLSVTALETPGHAVVEISLSEEGVARFSERGVEPLRQPVRIARSGSARPKPSEMPATDRIPGRNASLPGDTAAAARGARNPWAAGMDAVRIGRYEAAAQLLDEAADEAYAAFMELGLCQLRTDAADAAIRSFGVALRIRPGSVDAKRELARARRSRAASRRQRLAGLARRAARGLVRRWIPGNSGHV